MREKDIGKETKILDATLELINAQGLAQLSMSKIAKSAEVSPATIYIYFNNKEDLINKLYLKTKKMMSTAVFEVVDPDDDLKGQYFQILTNFINFIMVRKKEFLFLEQLQNSPVLDKETLKETDELFSTLSHVYKLGIEQKILKDINIKILSTVTFSISMEYVKLFHKDQASGSDSEINKIVEICWDAISLK